MIIFTDKTGQLGNQLFEFSTFIANALENNSGLLNLFFTDYKEYFVGPTSNHVLPLVKTSLGNQVTDKLIRKLIQSSQVKRLGGSFNRLLRGNGKPLDIHQINSRGKLLLKDGYWFTDYKNFYRYEKQIRSYFTPLNKYTDNITQFISKCRLNHDILIGIHIRKGDYKEFLGGEFYFEEEVYLDKALQIAKLFPDKKVAFIICSNENVDASAFKPLTVYTGLGHFIEDMYTLAQCDYIVGPPSTYTMWASFYGNKPLCKIFQRNQVINIEDFKRDYGY